MVVVSKNEFHDAARFVVKDRFDKDAISHLS